MPLPERLQPAKVNRQKLKQLADMAEEILAVYFGWLQTFG